MMAPEWLELLAKIALGLAILCAGIITLDIVSGNRQHMWIMDVVWPVTALWFGPVGLVAYFRLGRLSTRKAVDAAKRRGKEMTRRTDEGVDFRRRNSRANPGILAQSLRDRDYDR
jgi:hypothetical protein